MLFIIIVALSALFVASCAAFFSIKGLIALFSGSALAIGIMASSLEIGKLVAASFLHTYWKKANFLLKFYLSSAVLVLMAITSLGIFGFLTNAYQVHSAKVGTFDTKIAALVSEKSAVDQTILEHSSRIKTLTEIRAAQEQRIQTAGNYKAPRDQAYKAISEANEEIQKKEADIAQDRDRGIAIEKEIADLKITLNTTTDIGSFRFIAAALHTDVDTSVQYFIFVLIAVFDPLAVALVLAWNKLVEQRSERKKEEQVVFEKTLQTYSSAAPAIEIQPDKLQQKPVTAPPAKATFKSAEAAEKQPKLVQPAGKKSASQPTPTDPVSSLPIGDAVQPSENIQNLAGLSEEEKQRMLLARHRSSGKNDSVITRRTDAGPR